MEHCAFGVHIEVEVNFHTAFVSMARHGVPQIAIVQTGQPHRELAGWQHIRHQIFVNGVAIRSGCVSQRGAYRVLFADLFVGEGAMGRRAVEIELCRARSITAAENEVLRAFTDVQCLF